MISLFNRPRNVACLTLVIFHTPLWSSRRRLYFIYLNFLRHILSYNTNSALWLSWHLTCNWRRRRGREIEASWFWHRHVSSPFICIHAVVLVHVNDRHTLTRVSALWFVQCAIQCVYKLWLPTVTGVLRNVKFIAFVRATFAVTSRTNTILDFFQRMQLVTCHAKNKHYV